LVIRRVLLNNIIQLGEVSVARTSGFVNLHVYRLSEQLADDVWGIASKGRGIARDTVGKQLVRAADSIGANIAEGVGRGSYVDNRRFIRIARGSLYEVRHWLRRAYRRKLLTTEGINALKPLIAELGPRLNAYLRSIGDKAKTSSHANQMTNDK
jgi:four helix bundle protein